MAQSGYTPLLSYGSTTASNVPLAANLTTSASGVELAVNAADGKLFYKDTGGVVQVLASKGAGTIGGSNTQVQYNSSGALAGSANMTFNGTVLTSSFAGPVAATTLSASSTVTLSGGTANGVAYLNGSKVLTTGSALVFDGANLGIGTSTLTYKLNVYGAASPYVGVSDGTINTFFGASTGGSVAALGTTSNHPVSFYANGSEQMRLTSTGLGIGTSSLAAKLDVFKASYVDQYWRTGVVNTYLASDDSQAKAVFGTITTHPLTFYTNGAERMRLDSTGNLGLGFTPSAWYASGSGGTALQIGSSTGIYGFSSGANLQTRIYNNAYINNSSNDIYLVTGAAATQYQQTAGVHYWFNAPSGTAGNAITFTQAMTLNASGYLGIGATSPNSQLDIRFPATTPSNQLNQVLLQSLSNGSSSGLGARTGITFGNRTTDYVASGGVSTAGVYGINLDPTAFGRYMGLVFYTSTIDAAATEKMRIDEAGNLGLGVVPSAWGTSSNGLQFSGSNGQIASKSSFITIGANEYYDGSAYRYVTTSQQASYYQQAAGVHAWYNAPSGTAGNAITFTQAMTLDASGNLLVGTTSQLANGKFGVYNSSTGNGIEARIIGSGIAYSVYTARVDNTANLLHTFFYGNYSTVVGSITTNGTITVYNTTSDYRLKNNQAPLTGSGAFIDALQPKTWEWAQDGSKGVGFIAHEFAEVSPNSVNGKKDAVDADGKPVYQAMQASSAEVIANLVAEIQSLRKRLADAGIA
jgi:hypothetical protein